MGKNWKGGRKSFGSNSNHSNDLSSCRGLGIVIGTCDAARERETSKELLNLFNQIIEEINVNSNPNRTSDNSNRNENVSVQSILLQELNEIRTQNNNQTQNVISINTGVKGIVCIKFLHNYSPYEIVLKVFEKIKLTQKPCTRYVVRMIPFQYVFYPNVEDLKLNISYLFTSSKNSDSTNKRKAEDSPHESDDRSNKQPHISFKSENVVPEDLNTIIESNIDPSNNELTITKESNAISTEINGLYTYCVLFKARNHSTLTRADALAAVAGHVPQLSRLHLYSTHCQDVYMIEALKNIGFILRVPASVYEDKMEFNVRKFQARHVAPDDESTGLLRSDPRISSRSSMLSYHLDNEVEALVEPDSNPPVIPVLATTEKKEEEGQSEGEDGNSVDNEKKEC